MGFEHRGIFVAHGEFDAAVLEALKTAGVAQVRADGAVLGRCHGGQHVPGMDQLLHDPGDPCQLLEGRIEFVRRDVMHGSRQLVQHQLHPQLAGLVLHNEQQFVVIGRQRLLRIQDGVELQVVAVAHVTAEVELGLFFCNDQLGLAAAMHGAARGLLGCHRGAPLVRSLHGLD